MKKLLSAVALSVLVAGPALAGEAVLLNDGQLDGVTAGRGEDRCCDSRINTNGQIYRNNNFQQNDVDDTLNVRGRNAIGGNNQTNGDG